MAQYPSNSVLRQPGDPHLGHHLRYLRLVRRGNRVNGKKRLQQLHPAHDDCGGGEHGRKRVRVYAWKIPLCG